MIRVVSYQPATGQIVHIMQTGSMQQAAASTWQTCELLEIDFSLPDMDLVNLYYIVNSTLVPRPVGTAVLAGHKLTGLPLGGTLRVGPDTHTITEHDAELEFQLPGTYRIVVEKFPITTQVFEVTV